MKRFTSAVVVLLALVAMMAVVTSQPASASTPPPDGSYRGYWVESDPTVLVTVTFTYDPMTGILLMAIDFGPPIGVIYSTYEWNEATGRWESTTNSDYLVEAPPGSGHWFLWTASGISMRVGTNYPL